MKIKLGDICIAIGIIGMICCLFFWVIPQLPANSHESEIPNNSFYYISIYNSSGTYIPCKLVYCEDTDKYVRKEITNLSIPICCENFTIENKNNTNNTEISTFDSNPEIYLDKNTNSIFEHKLCSSECALTFYEDNKTNLERYKNDSFIIAGNFTEENCKKC